MLNDLDSSTLMNIDFMRFKFFKKITRSFAYSLFYTQIKPSLNKNLTTSI
jgi:hypothetical protein